MRPRMRQRPAVACAVTASASPQVLLVTNVSRRQGLLMVLVVMMQAVLYTTAFTLPPPPPPPLVRHSYNGSPRYPSLHYMVKVLGPSSSSSSAHGMMTKVRTRSNSANSKAHKAFETCLLKLGRGILFAKPAGSTISQALFGLSIKSRRKNDKHPTENDTTVSFTLKEALVAVTVYFSMGVAVYSYWMEHWSWIDALYFSMAVFTTVGFGDVVPSADKPGVKVFTCLFSLGGIAFLAAALASIGSRMMETEKKAAHEVKRRWYNTTHQRQRLQRWPGMVLNHLWWWWLRRHHQRSNNSHNQHKHNNGHAAAASTDINDDIDDSAQHVTAVVPFTPRPVQVQDHQAPPPPKVSVWHVVGRIIPRIGVLVALGLLLGHFEHWSVVDSVYYSLITASTIGFGDIAPTRQCTRLLAVVLIPLAVAMGGEILGIIASAFLQRRRAVVFNHLVKQDFSMEHIKEMDSNGDGQVSKLDYIQFMLVEMQFVDRGVLEELESQFDRLDMTKGGTLSKEDLILMAKMRRRKLEGLEDGVVDV